MSGLALVNNNNDLPKGGRGRRNITAGQVLFGAVFGLYVLYTQLAVLRTRGASDGQLAGCPPQQPEGGTAGTSSSTNGTGEITTNWTAAERAAAQSDDKWKQNGNRNSEGRGGVVPDSYKSPVEMMMNHFPNAAVERVARQHDRYVVQSLVYLNQFDEKAVAEYARAAADTKKTERKLMTVVILTVNRDVPYLAVPVSMLLKGHDPAVFAKKMDVHVANIERRAGRERYSLFEDLRRKLGSGTDGLMRFYNWTDKYPEHAHLEYSYFEDQKRDYVRALEICKEGGSKWCVIFEDDAIPCVDFATKFERHVHDGGYPHVFVQPDHSHLDRVAAVKLYHPLNHFWNRLHDDKYIRPGGEHKRDAAPDLMEKRRDGAAIKNVEYSLEFSLTYYGVVANAYPSTVLDAAIDILKEKNRQPTDVLLSRDLVAKTGFAHVATMPSMVNHIGYFSEHRSGKDWRKELSTDVRFQLDDGPPLASSTPGIKRSNARSKGRVQWTQQVRASGAGKR